MHNFRKGSKVTLTTDLLKAEPERWSNIAGLRLPKVGTTGVVLAVQQGTWHLLVKWQGHAGPVSVDHTYVTGTLPS